MNTDKQETHVKQTDHREEGQRSSNSNTQPKTKKYYSHYGPIGLSPSNYANKSQQSKENTFSGVIGDRKNRSFGRTMSGVGNEDTQGATVPVRYMVASQDDPPKDTEEPTHV